MSTFPDSHIDTSPSGFPSAESTAHPPIAGEASRSPLDHYCKSAVPLSAERLLGTQEICDITHLSKATSARLMKETGRCLRIHGRLYVLESSFIQYLHELEAMDPCSL